MNRKPIKITDIAALAGVSIATVSRAIGKSGPVSQDARRRIEAALLATGYTPNNVGRGLRRREARAIIVVVPDVGNPYFSALLRGIEERAVAIGYSVLIGNGANNREREAVYGQHAMAGRADGLILINGRLPYAESVVDTRLPPIVLVSERIARVGLPLVGVDNVRAARDAVSHLLQLGHRRIGYIGGTPRSLLTADREAGYRKALAIHGLDIAKDWVAYGDFTVESGEQSAQRLLDLDRPPTAIFACNDEMAIGAISAAKARSMRVPDDISIVGFDDIPFAASYDPPLTTVRQPFFEMGAAAMDMMIQLIAGQVPARRKVLLPTELVIRKSASVPSS
jgi:LacI family repressor for deo operon, udp, cdd, tsx, nupC, and nupG